MLQGMRYYGQTREIFFPGEEVQAKYGTAFLRAIVIEVMGEGSYKVKLIDYDNLVYVNTDFNQIKKYDTKRRSLDFNNEMRLSNYFQDNFYERNSYKDRYQHQSPIRKSWKTYSSPRKMNLHNYIKYQSPKKSLLNDLPYKEKKTSSSPMTDIIENLKTLIDSPVMGRFQKSPMVNFSRTPGSRKMLSAMNGNSNSFFGGINQNLVGPPEKEQVPLGYPRNNVNFHRHSTHPYQDVPSSFMSHPEIVLPPQFKLKEKPKPSPNQPYLTWTGKLPLKDINDNKYSRKVFLGGVPWDITNDDLENTFSLFGDLSVEWPPVKNGQKPKGYVYIVFDESSSVNKLLEFCRSYSERVFRDVSDGTMYKYHVQSEKMKSKEIQVIPWNLNDSTKVIGPQDKVNMHHQVFVGGLHGMLTATGLSQVMNDLFGNVVYVEIDTDKFKYPLGSGRVNFSRLESYQQAIQGKYVQVNCSAPKIEKRIQIDPYIRENENCSKCLDYPGPLYCRSCLDYFCEGCWDYHMRHSSVKHEWVSRTRNGKVI